MVTIEKVGSGTGVVTSEPAGIDCGATCNALFESGICVDLIPVADSGSIFTGWSGDADCVDGRLAITSTITCTASFYDELDVIFLDGFESGDTSAW